MTAHSIGQQRDQRPLGWWVPVLVALGVLFILGDVLFPAAYHQWLDALAAAAGIALAVRCVAATRSARAASAQAVTSQEQLAARTRELARSEERLGLAQEVARVGTWDLTCPAGDMARGETTWSESLRDLSGVGPDFEASYDAFLNLVHQDDRAHVTEAMSRALQDDSAYEIEFRLCRPDGETRWLLDRGRAIYDEHGMPIRILGVAMDITDRKAAAEEREALEDQLRQAQKLESVGRLAGGIAHDFNNVLLGIRGYGELALRALARGEDAHEEVQEILAGADRAAALTRQLLAFGRRQLLQPEAIDLNDAVADIDKLLRRVIGEDVELQVRAAPAPVTVNADRGQLEQVIANLAVNAREAMPDGGGLTLEVDSVRLNDGLVKGVRPGRYALLAVTDTGIGMDSETTAQVFEPFFTTKADGTGLGLATVHGIVKQSGGSIWIYSEVGRGSTFKVYLPLAGQAAADDEPTQPADDARGEGETILLVEDDGQVRAIVREMLEARDYRVISSERGEEALLLADEDAEIDLLLTDIVMPGLNGREVASQLRHTHPNVAVLYMSGYTDDAIVRRGIFDRDSALIQKPFNSDELASKVRQALDARTASRA